MVKKGEKEDHRTKNVAVDVMTHKFIRMESLKEGKSSKELVHDLCVHRYGKKALTQVG